MSDTADAGTSGTPGSAAASARPASPIPRRASSTRSERGSAESPCSSHSSCGDYMVIEHAREGAVMLQGLIMDMPLMISSAIEHAAAFHGATEIVAREVD